MGLFKKKICLALECSVTDIVELVPDRTVQKEAEITEDFTMKMTM